MAAASPTPIAETAPEVWRAVVGYETEYEVSNHGRVRRLRFRNGCTRFTLETPVLMKPGKRGGYLYVALSLDGRPRKHTVHSLVASAFLGARPDGMVIAHLDGDGFNPALSNLAYVTASENEGHKRVHGRNTKFRGSDTPTAALTVEQVREMRALRDRFGEKLPYWQLGKMFDVGMRAALNVCTGRTYRDVT